MGSHLKAYLKAVFSTTISGMIFSKQQKHTGISKNSTNWMFSLYQVQQGTEKVLTSSIEKLVNLKENILVGYLCQNKKITMKYGIQFIDPLVKKQVIKWH